jgi:hypothetical protein
MSTENKYSLEVWIGLAKVKSNTKGSLNAITHGYVNVLGLSNSKQDFRKKASLKFQDIGLKLIRLEDAEPFSKRMKTFKVDKSIQAIAKNILQQTVVDFGTVHTYD